MIQNKLPCGLSIHKYTANAGTAPKTTKSERESRCIPNSLVDFNKRATLPSNMSKTEAISQNSENGLKSANFWAIKAKKIPDSEFLQGFWYSNTLEDTKEKILGSFQPKLMSKFEVISQKPPKY